jgi:hypothetical protein
MLSLKGTSSQLNNKKITDLIRKNHLRLQQLFEGFDGVEDGVQHVPFTEVVKIIKSG